MLSFLFYYVNLPKGELLVNLCVSILIDINWNSTLIACRLVGAMPLSEPMLEYC